MSGHQREKQTSETLMAKLTCEAITRALGSFIFVKESIILEINDQQY